MRKNVLYYLRHFFTITFCPRKYFGTATITLQKSLDGEATLVKEIQTRVFFDTGQKRWLAYIPVEEVKYDCKICLNVSFDQKARHKWMPICGPEAKELQNQLNEQKNKIRKSYRLTIAA